jgi:hypothetical protein
MKPQSSIKLHSKLDLNIFTEMKVLFSPPNILTSHFEMYKYIFKHKIFKLRNYILTIFKDSNAIIPEANKFYEEKYIILYLTFMGKTSEFLKKKFCFFLFRLENLLRKQRRFIFCLVIIESFFLTY